MTRRRIDENEDTWSGFEDRRCLACRDNCHMTLLDNAPSQIVAPPSFDIGLISATLLP